MTQAQNGDTVQIHYTGRLDDGTVFDTSEDRDPLEFTLGDEQVIPGFEKAVEGMEEGESKTAEIPADDAYGEHRDDLVVSVPRDRLPDDMDPDVGDRLQMQSPDGHTFNATVVDQDASSLKMDANHPLAGKDLTFDIELVEISD